MKPLAFAFLLVGTISVVIGMGWGIQMSATADHTLSPAHAHLNLLGWVTMALFAFFYQLVPGADQGLLPKLHFGSAVLGLVIIIPGIVMAVKQTGETMAKIGSVLTLLSMILFLVVVLTKGRQST